MSLMIEYVRNLIPTNWKPSPSGWHSGNCPMCITNGQARPDTRGRGGFHFDDDKFQYHCFNCHYKTGWSPGNKVNNRLKNLLLKFGADEAAVQRLQLELMRELDITHTLMVQERRKKLVIDWPEVALPEDCKPFMDHTPDTNWTEAVEYLTNRGFDITDPRLMYSPAKQPARMSKRFVIPFYYKNKVIGYTGRWIGKPPEGMPKYYNQQPPKNFVYGLDRQHADKEIVILTEGPLDAIITDGISAGTNTISEEQADVILSLNKQIIVLPDADEAGMKMVDAAVKYGWSVAFPEWDDCNDAGDALMKYGRLFTVRSILDSAISNPTKIQVIGRKYCK